MVLNIQPLDIFRHTNDYSAMVRAEIKKQKLISVIPKTKNRKLYQNKRQSFGNYFGVTVIDRGMSTAV